MRNVAGCLLSLLLVAAPSGIRGEEPPPLLAPAGGGPFVVRDDGPHLDEAERHRIQAEIRHNVARLRAVGRLPAEPRGSSVPLAWPLRAAAGLLEPGHHGISNFVDQNPAFPGQLLDYNCGIRTYDQSSGYNHAGVDYFTWPFAWRRMDAGQVEVIAAAPGTIVLKADGNFDRSCDFLGLPWNAVYVMHADGSIAWYGHLKNGSVTSKAVGETVAAGEFLGVVGSSGNSTAPHLHLEVYDASGNLNEPYQGPCNSLNSNSWWIAQRPYYDSAINELTTGPAPAIFPACPQVETPNERTWFARGSTIYFTAYYRDQLIGQLSTYRIRRPDGTINLQWTHSISVSHYQASWWYWFFNNVASSGPDGTWTFEVTYNGQTTVRPFTIGGFPAGRVPGDLPTEAPLRVANAGSQITLTWARSCIDRDDDYAIYEGVLGNYYSHAARFCATGGATSKTFEPNHDAAYYLVVATNGVREGSYGHGVAAAERPVGTGACLMREIGVCP